MTDLTWLLSRAALAGAASGARSQTALAALSLTAERDARAQPDRTLGRTGVKVIAVLGAAVEGVLDKLPITPSRLEPAGLLPRIAAGAACGVIISRRAFSGGAMPPSAGTMAGCALTGAAAAGASAWLGARWRAFAAPRLGHDWIGALIEDAAAVTLAAVAAEVD
jgi:uncharacterized membrane protein